MGSYKKTEHSEGTGSYSDQTDQPARAEAHLLLSLLDSSLPLT